MEDRDGPRAGVTGLQTCGSIWSCPVCAAHIRQARAEDIAEAVRRHRKSGGELLFLTLTIRHNRGESLVDTLAGLLGSWRQTIMGAPWARKRKALGIVGTIRATEVTYGDANGWHPHLHVLLFVDRKLSQDEREDLGGWLTSRWAKLVTEQGLGRPSAGRGVDLQEVATDGEGVGHYLAKVQDERSVSLELARADLKHGRGKRLLPFDLAAAAGDGESRAVALWHEFERATHRRRCIEWSRGLRDRLGMGDESTDDELVRETGFTSETLVAVLPAGVWRTVVRAGLDHRLIEAVEHDGEDGLWRVVNLAHELDPSVPSRRFARLWAKARDG